MSTPGISPVPKPYNSSHRAPFISNGSFFSHHSTLEENHKFIEYHSAKLPPRIKCERVTTTP